MIVLVVLVLFKFGGSASKFINSFDKVDGSGVLEELTLLEVDAFSSNSFCFCKIAADIFEVSYIGLMEKENKKQIKM